MKDNVTDLFGREEAKDLLTATLQRKRPLESVISSRM